ncbi:MAG: alpha/beta fold hydrolase [Acidobacteriota bacterium]
MTNWASGTCKANGISIHYLRTGGDKRPLIALHRLTGSGVCWTPVARSLEDDYDVVIPDARGHGKSSAPRNGYLYQDLAKDVAGLVEKLRLPDPVIMGHSMGGMTAAVAARQLGAANRAVILADPTFISPERQREAYESNVFEQHRQFLNSSMDALLADLRLRHPYRSSEILEYMAEARLATQAIAFEVLNPHQACPNVDRR